MTVIQHVDVLCVGHASHDLVFSVPHHPAADEKIFAETLLNHGGGPAANAAVAVARLGFTAAFAGYLGHDLYGQAHLEEFRREGVCTQLVQRGTSPTPLSAILVKPNGPRALVNYKGDTQALPANSIDFSTILPKVILFDGHEPHISEPLAARARQLSIPTVLDAGSLHAGTERLMFAVDYLACSEKFARQWLSEDHPERALLELGKHSPAVLITLGERGLIWKRNGENGSFPAFPVNAVDTTGAGDAFHGAFAAALADHKTWPEILRYASAVGALCCTRLGARAGLPQKEQVVRFFETFGWENGILL